MFSSLFSIFSALLLALFYLVNAAPVQFLAFSPTIITPTNRTVWNAGSNQTVTWRTDNVPTAAQNYTLTILLGQLTNSSENLDINSPLAAQIPIMSGVATVSVPSNASYATNYIVAVIGTSGDISQPFTIVPLNTSVALH